MTHRKPQAIRLADRESSKNVFEEFKRLVLTLENQKVRYTLVAGVAMGF